MPRWPGSAGSGPLIWMLSNATSTAWFKQHQRKDDEKKMTDRDQYAPGPASAAQIQEDGEKWTLIVVREFRHPPEKLWAGAHRPGASARVDAL